MNTTNKSDFALAFLKRGAVIPANLMPDTMDEYGLSFSYDAPNGSNYIIDMDRNGKFSATRFEINQEHDQWEDAEEYEHQQAKAIALEAGIIYMRKAN